MSVKDENFMENTSNSLCNLTSMRSTLNEIRNERMNQSINAFKECAEDSRMADSQ